MSTIYKIRDMEIIYSDHAEERFSERKIDRHIVNSVIKNCDRLANTSHDSFRVKMSNNLISEFADINSDFFLQARDLNVIITIISNEKLLVKTAYKSKDSYKEPTCLIKPSFSANIDAQIRAVAINSKC